MILQEAVSKTVNQLRRVGVVDIGAHRMNQNQTRGMVHPARNVKICCIPIRVLLRKIAKNVAGNSGTCHDPLDHYRVVSTLCRGQESHE